jgi:hypothetical protein
VLVLTLLTAAQAADLRLHVAVSGGQQRLPTMPVGASPGPVVRFELGAGPAMAQGYFLAQLAIHDTRPYYDSVAYGLPATFVGDFLMTELGVGARFPIPVGQVRFIPHADLGLVMTDTPMDPGFYRSDVVPEFYTEPNPGLHGRGAFAQAGGDVGLVLYEDVVTGYAGFDVGYSTIRGLGVLLNVRFGLAAAF